MSFPSFPEYNQQKGASFGKRVFLKDFGQKRAYTYEEFARLSARMAKGLAKMGIEEGEIGLLSSTQTIQISSWPTVPLPMPGEWLFP